MTGRNELHTLRLEMQATQRSMSSFMGISLRAYEELEAGRTALRPIHINAAKYACILLAGEPAVETRGIPPQVRDDLISAGYGGSSPALS